MTPHPLVVLVLALAAVTAAGAAEIAPGPAEFVYKQVGAVALKVAVFRPPAAFTGLRPAVAVFHGGGWSLGDPRWNYGDAQRLAAAGCVGIGVQYRLSSQTSDAVTPLDAIADARDGIRWIRAHATEFGVDPHRIAALGWSAGGHLAACTAVVPDPDAHATVNSAPDALLLWFPALALEYDDWIAGLLHGRADKMAISPAEFVRPGLPPTLILIGREDTVTPLAGAEKFRHRMLAAGNRCDLHVYAGVGHSFEDRPGHIDPAVDADSKVRTIQFLRDLGWLPAEQAGPFGSGRAPARRQADSQS